MDVAIRTGTAADIEAVLAFWRAATVESSTDDEEAMRTLVDRDPETLLIAEDTSAIVGTLVVGWDGWRGAFYRLAVAPSRRRRGIASALLEAGEERLEALGARRVAAIIITEHDDATGFWSAAGYEHMTGVGRFVKQLALRSGR